MFGKRSTIKVVNLIFKSNLIIIDTHDKGPNFSALQVKNIKDDDELIIIPSSVIFFSTSSKLAPVGI